MKYEYNELLFHRGPGGSSIDFRQLDEEEVYEFIANGGDPELQMYRQIAFEIAVDYVYQKMRGGEEFRKAAMENPAFREWVDIADRKDDEKEVTLDRFSRGHVMYVQQVYSGPLKESENPLVVMFTFSASHGVRAMFRRKVPDTQVAPHETPEDPKR